MELCVARFFILVRREDRTYVCIGQVVIMIVLTAFTVAFQIMLNNEFGSLLQFLPFELRELNSRNQADTDITINSQEETSKLLCGIYSKLKPN